MALISALTRAILTTRTADGTNQTLRTGPYGDLFVQQSQIAPDSQAFMGAHFQALTTPAVTPTGTAMGIQTTFSDTANILFHIGNSSSTQSIIMDYIRVRITAAGTTTTSAEAAFEVDATNRYSSGGVSITAANNNGAASGLPASISRNVTYAGVTAAAAGANRRWLWHQLIRQAAAPVWIVHDTVTFAFGAYGSWAGQSVAIQQATAQGTHFFWPVAPAVVPPGGSGLLHLANIANASTAPSVVVEASWYEL